MHDISKNQELKFKPLFDINANSDDKFCFFSHVVDTCALSALIVTPLIES